MSGCLQAVVEQGLNLPPQLPLLAVCRGHVDEQLILQQHVDVSSLQTAPAALRLARGLVVLRRQVIQHGALVSPPRLQLNSEANEVTGETCDLNLEGAEWCLSLEACFPICVLKSEFDRLWLLIHNLCHMAFFFLNQTQVINLFSYVLKHVWRGSLIKG